MTTWWYGADGMWRTYGQDPIIPVPPPSNVQPTAAFAATTSGLGIQVDGSASSDPDGTVVSWSWNWGDNTTPGSGVTATHAYAKDGTYTVTLTVRDENDADSDPVTQRVTVAAPVRNNPPVAAFTATAVGTAATFTFDASGSSDVDGTITGYAWSTGDGGTGSGKTFSHTYKATGTYLVTLTVTDDDGSTGKAQKNVTANVDTGGGGGGGGGGAGTHVWDTTDASVGFPSGLNYVNWSTLYNALSSAEKSSANMVTAAFSKLTSLSVVVVPNGWDVTQSQWGNAGGSALFLGKNCAGLLCVDGPEQARINFGTNSLPSGTASTLNAQTHGTTQTFYHFGTSNSTYIGGITFQGNPQGANKLQGISWYHVGPNSIFQYNRLLGMGNANDTSPPGETFAWQENSSQSLTFRNTEIDGRYRSDSAGVGSSGFLNPTMGAYASGMWGGNHATAPTLSNCYLHASNKSGLTFSYSGTSYNTKGAPTSPSSNVRTNYVTVEDNDWHQVGAGGFPGINHEGVLGQNIHDHPTIKMSGVNFGSVWNCGHINWCGTSDNAGSTLTILEPTWTGSAQNATGFFAIRTYGWYTGSDTGFKDMPQPTVVKNGVTLKAWTRTNSSTPPAGVTPATHFVWNKG